MAITRPRTGRTVGLRFTIMYAAVFLLCAIGLLLLTYLLSGGQISSTSPVQNPPPDGSLAAAQQRIRLLEDQLAEVHAQQSSQLLFGSVIALVVMAIVSIVLGRVLARRVLRPLRQITSATRAIGVDNLDQRLAVDGPADEVKDLADTIDDLLQRLEASFTAQRRFVANASHELRTPLATMRASLDVAAAKPKPAAQTVALTERLRTQLDRVDDLLDGFLALARTQDGALPDPVPVDCGELIDHALAARRSDIAAKHLELSANVESQLWTRGNPALLSRMFENIIENAVLHNDEHGGITVRTTRDSAWVGLEVETGGRILDQAEVDRLTKPFERLGRDRTGSDEGSGLGLTIVAAIAEAHDGRLDLRARPEGGLRVAITLPSAPAPVAESVAT